MNDKNLQQRLKEETAELHRESEQHPLMQSFVTGSFKKEHLLDVLINLLPIYQVVEQRLISKEIINNPELKRSINIQKDIDKLVQDIGLGNRQVRKITSHWLSFSWSRKLDLLKGDLYLRWLADFYGGRILAKSQAPYNETYASENPGAVITTVRYILDQTSNDTTDDEIVEHTKGFFKFHIQLFEDIWTN
jgi:heme oxygenase